MESAIEQPLGCGSTRCDAICRHATMPGDISVARLGSRRPVGTLCAERPWEIEASVSSARDVLLDGSEQRLVRVQIVDHDNADPAARAFIDLRSRCARRLALEILAAADDADWQTEQDGCPEPAR